MAESGHNPTNENRGRSGAEKGSRTATPFERLHRRSTGALLSWSLLSLSNACTEGSLKGSSTLQKAESVQESSPAVQGEVARESGLRPAPPGIVGEFEVILWQDVYDAGDLEKAWAIASDHGDLEKIEILLGDGVDPDMLVGNDGYKQPALVEAAWLGYEKIVDRLLAAGADPMAREVYYRDAPFYESGKGDTALHKAALKGHPGILEKLLEAGAQVDARGIEGRTPLAGVSSDLQTFQLLIEAGADLERAGGVDSLFANAVSSDAVDLASFLLSRGALIEGDERHRGFGYTPLWSAAVGGREEMVLFLLERGADPRVRPGGSPLEDLARKAGHERVAALLLRAKAGEPLRPAVEAGR